VNQRQLDQNQVLIGKVMRVVLAGGGTAGHIEPALAIATELVGQGISSHAEIQFVGGYRGLEGRLVPARGFSLHQINIIGLPRKLSVDLLKYPFKLFMARRNLMRFFKDFKPDVVIGFGGYVAAPGYLAAKKLGIPFLVHEANARPGVANRKAAKYATKVIDSVSGSMPNAETLGVPVRAELVNLDRRAVAESARKYFGLTNTNLTILVFGGSQGAERINSATFKIADQLCGRGLNIIHIAGELNYQKYQTKKINGAGEYKVISYCDRMDLAYAAADLAVTRSGALTVAELAIVGLPAILVPYPVGNGEQLFNAEALVKAGAAKLLLNQDCSDENLAKLILELIENEHTLQAMHEAALRVANPTATKDIVEAIKLVVK
jgi:UDP-N-acetylglucosamine--N-acetylmuramyl-(pentapeptide) pyrophosphoryl-undecaprenol N-acetylglucosamine transferase